VITGEFKATLDDKGRILLPSRVRTHFENGTITLTTGIDTCLWIFSPDEWQRICDNLTESTNLFQSRARLIQRRIIAPAQEAEFDKTGRITVSPALRDFANLKKECVILAIGTHLEIWDEEIYRQYWEENETEFQVAAEELGKILSL
jgi:MraZ protein